MMDSKELLRVEHLTKYFTLKAGVSYVHAVEDVSLSIKKGETLGLVGESGCGKTTLGRSILRLYEPTSGKIIFDGETVFDGAEKKHKPPTLDYRRRMQVIFQDPSASLDPRQTVGEIIGEALDIHHIVTDPKERWDRVIYILGRVGITAEQADRYPHEFSGGQQQRVGIARAMAVNPEFIVCDEPISALDVSIQSQIVNMLEDAQEEFGLTYLFIAHDISVVKHISNRIGVMYLGTLVEMAESYELNSYPLHPYTRLLLSAVPIPDPKLSREREKIRLPEGEMASPINPGPGCRFASRCPYANEKCWHVAPQLREAAPEHFVACHLYNNV